MERILTADQMRTADKFTIENLGVSEQILVQRAGKAVADEIIKRFRGGRVLVCVGKGNNGEDGKVVAKLLEKKHGFSVSVINVYNGVFKLFEQKYDIIVDCIFGTGLNRPVDGFYKKAIDYINNSGAFVISCDIPSGINGNNGQVMGTAVKSRLTIAIQEYKTGHFLGEAPDYTGEIVLKDIGISVWDDDFIYRVNQTDCKKFFPERSRLVHKGSFGKTVVIGGSKRFSGSAVLALNALLALKTGNGYSTLVVPDCIFSSLVGLYPECILNAIDDKDDGIQYCPEKLKQYLNADSIVFGMGVGVSIDVYNTIKFLLENYCGRLLIDADGLNSLAQFGVDILKNKKCEVVLTPHVGEFARLINVEKQALSTDAISFVKKFAKDYKVIVNLKSAVSIITDGEQVVLNTTGCNGMAKAGSGDVLSGLLGGLIARDEDLFTCVCVGAYLFGKTGEKAQSKFNSYTLTASDVVNALPEVINSL